MDYVLKPLKNLEGEEVRLSSDPTGELIQLDPDENVKYAMVINVGDLPPVEARKFLEGYLEKLVEFFGSDRILLIPRRSADDPNGTLFKIEPAEQTDGE